MSTALITGAGRGLGLELARQYAADGWRVIGTVRDAKGEAALRAVGAESLVVEVTDYAAMKQRLASIDTPIDLLFCNAGIIGTRGRALGSFEYDEWDRIFRVNVLGVAATIEALADRVAASEKKLIAVMSSRLGSITESSGMTLPYATSKAAVNMLVKGIAGALGQRGITVVSLAPGWVRTDMGGEDAPLDPETSVRGLRQVLGRLKAPDAGKFLLYDGTAIPW